MQQLNDRTFPEFIAAGKKIVIATAGYCNPCRQAMEKLKSSPQSIGVVELTDANSVRTMLRLKIDKIPTVIYYTDGAEVNRAVGTAALFNITGQA